MMNNSTPSKAARAALILVTAFSLSACSIFKGSGKSKFAYDDEGRERISILNSGQALEVDVSVSGVAIVLPKPYANASWAQVGGNSAHSVQHLELSDSLSLAWRRKIGAGNKKYERMVAGPVSGSGRVFAVDVEGTVTAVSLSTGKRIWSREVTSPEERSDVGFGGGAALYGDTVYVTSGHGIIVALDAASGREEWRYSGVVPFRGAPTASKDRLFAVTHDNQMLAFDPSDGTLLWDQVGIAESAGMLGAASPAFDGNTIVTALSSGELIAMRGANGRILWQDALTSSKRLTPLATLTDIDGNPVIDGGRVYAVSHAGRMVAVDMRTGERSWEADVAGVSTPWVAGEYGYVTTVDGEVACIYLSNGRVRWVQQLQRFTDQEERRGLISWNGPILAGDRLLVTSTHGYAVSLSPYTGDVLSGVELPAGSSTAPIVVDGTFIVLTDDGELVAYR
ncbi:MAG: PQQ-like beta-propeller repeat protein [Kordiimonadaceae bacterium]|nr:PQQ-like beta-propeller repeat protein [Kordiimonadaceae bacterium]